MAQFSLDDIRNAAEKKYANVEITFGEGDSVRLVNPLRLTKANRDLLVALQDDLNERDADQAKLLADGIRIVADDADAAKRLLDAVDGDLAILAGLFETYTDGTQAGEA